MAVLAWLSMPPYQAPLSVNCHGAVFPSCEAEPQRFVVSSIEAPTTGTLGAQPREMVHHAPLEASGRQAGEGGHLEHLVTSGISRSDRSASLSISPMSISMRVPY